MTVCNAALDSRQAGVQVLALTRTFFVLLDGAYLCEDDHLDDDYTGCEGYEAGDRLFVAVTQEWPADRYKGQPALVAQMKDRAYWEGLPDGVLLHEESVP